MGKFVMILFVFVALFGNKLAATERIGEDEVMENRFGFNLIVQMIRAMGQLKCDMCLLLSRDSNRCNMFCTVGTATTAAIPTTTTTPCPTTLAEYEIFVEAGNTYAYIISGDLGKTWDEAKLECESLGMHLAAFETVEEYTAVKTILDTKLSPKYSLLIGLRKTTPPNYTWITDGSANAITWSNNGSTSEDCAMIEVNPGSTRDGPNSVPCDFPERYICECNP